MKYWNIIWTIIPGNWSMKNNSFINFINVVPHLSFGELMAIFQWRLGECRWECGSDRRRVGLKWTLRKRIRVLIAFHIKTRIIQHDEHGVMFVWIRPPDGPEKLSSEWICCHLQVLKYEGLMTEKVTLTCENNNKKQIIKTKKPHSITKHVWKKVGRSMRLFNPESNQITFI